MDFLAGLVADILQKVLETLLARKDISDKTRLKIANDALTLRNRALGWAATHLDPGGLHDTGGKLELAPPDASPKSPPS